LELAEAAECSADQGKFWEFIDTAYAKQDQLSTKAITEWATSLGIDAELFNRCMKSDIKRDTILADYAAGEDAGVSGTPTYLVNGTKVESNLQAIGAAIQTALAGGGQRL
jgi:protein-disulfide isomerase